MNDYPFIYIAALMRTGSTLLSEVLTELPHAFIFREPHIGKNTFRVKESDLALFQQHGFNLEGFLKYRLVYAFLQRRLRFLGYRQDYMVRVFKHQLMPRLAGTASQLGVKEIRNRGWHNYMRHFPDMKVILTARDPRDIYLSLYYGWKNGKFKRRERIIPEEIAAELNQEFELQLAIAGVTDPLRVRYEDLCTQPDLIPEIRAFVHSPLQTGLKVGHFNLTHPRRQDEAYLHDGRITDQSVSRWKREEDRELIVQAQRVFELMPEFVEFWGYEW